MTVDLYRLSKVSWAVSDDKKNTEVFTTIETASQYMVQLGVNDDEIDVALIEMAARGHTRANFGINGNFTFSDGTKHDGIVGTA